MTELQTGTVDDVELVVDDTGTAWITLDRPDKRNAMTIAMWRRLGDICRGLAGERSVRAAVISGRGKSFCAGADISNLKEDDAALRAAVDDAQELLRGLQVPTIARIQGHCWGGGLEIAVNCDVRIAEPHASFAIPPAKLGVVYPVHAIQALVWLIGPSATKRLIYTAKPITTHEALRLGLIDAIAEGHREGLDDLQHAIRDELDEMAGKSLLSMASTKSIINTICEEGDYLADYRRWRQIWAASPDALEGPSAFLEKRSPEFGWHPADLG